MKEIEHIGIILDGNRRWARKRGLSEEIGHEFGKNRAMDVMEWCFTSDIKVLTLYVFSIENFKRSNNEIRHIMKLLRDEYEMFIQDKKEIFMRYDIQINFIGDRSKLGHEAREIIEQFEHMTQDFETHILNICLAYGGRDEILDGVKYLCQKVDSGVLIPEDIDMDMIRSSLYLPDNVPDIDMIIRTGGEKRLSNFMLWYVPYAELFFTNTLWPAFSKQEFNSMLDEFDERSRRFGGDSNG